MYLIEELRADSPLFPAVIELGNANKSTLGLFPAAAIKEIAAAGRLLVATESSGTLAAYLLYSLSKRKRHAKIIHLCVSKEHRGKGLTHRLVGRLSEITHVSCRGVRVHCRRDYEANAVWPRLGFVATGEFPGRGRDGKPVDVWWLDHGHGSLFSDAARRAAESKTLVVLDANVFFDIELPGPTSSDAVLALREEWLADDLELCLTDEIYQEIHRCEDSVRRRRARGFLAAYSFPPQEAGEMERVEAELIASVFGVPSSQRDESDIRQIARTAAAGVSVFVTQDRGILRHADEVYAICAVRIVAPTDLILEHDALSRESEYRPVRVAEQFRRRLVRSGEIRGIAQRFLNDGEKLRPFERRVAASLAYPRACRGTVVEDATGGVLGFVLTDGTSDGHVRIDFLRTAEGALSSTLNRWLVAGIVGDAVRDAVSAITIQDPYVTQDQKSALYELGFREVGGVWLKANMPGIWGVAECASGLRDMLPSQTDGMVCWTDAIEEFCARVGMGMADLLELESTLFPAKLRELALPVLLVPIQPGWAIRLFDSELADRDLIGGGETLLMVENVYYSAAVRRTYGTPGRVLWYVSAADRKYCGCPAVRGCSHLEEITVGTAKELFTRFRRLGVYEWSDILRKARGDSERRLVALRFCRTELFPRPIGLDELRGIWKREFGKQFHPQAPMSLPHALFLDLYQRGMQNLKAPTNGE